jgi:hypothetical protein
VISFLERSKGRLAKQIVVRFTEVDNTDRDCRFLPSLSYIAEQLTKIEEELGTLVVQCISTHGTSFHLKHPLPEYMPYYLPKYAVYYLVYAVKGDEHSASVVGNCLHYQKAVFSFGLPIFL